MAKRFYSLIFIFSVILLIGSAHAEVISQSFDSNGAMLASGQKKNTADRPTKAFRYTVPEGTTLRKDISYEFYPVFGKSFAEVVKSAEENGPFMRSKGRRFTSKFDWSVGYSYTYDYTYDIDEEGETVRATIDIEKVDPTYDISITLPALLDDTALNPVEKKLWSSYFQRLLDAEYKRADIVEDPTARKKLVDDIREIKGLAFDLTDESAIEHSVEVFLREESEQIGYSWARKIREKLDLHDRKTGSDARTQRRRYPFRKRTE